MTRRRARNPREREARRRQLLQAAAELFDEQSIHTLTVASIARQAGLAKGTLYLYFDTREELFLYLLLDSLTDWVDSLGEDLGEGPFRSEALAPSLAASLERRTRLLRLLGVLSPILEQNISDDAALEFKREVRDQLTRGAALVEARSEVLDDGDGFPFMLRLLAVTIGFSGMARPAPPVRAAIEADPSLERFQVDLQAELTLTLRALLQEHDDL